VAHHLVLPAGERPDYGPVSLLQSGWFLTSRSGTDRHDMPRLPASVGAPPAGPLDDRWANHLASLVLRGTGFIARLPRDVDAIEALRQLEQAIPLERQWDLTFLLGGAAFTDGVLVRLLSAESQPTAAASVLDLAEAEPADTREAPATEAGEAAVLSLEPPERRRAWIIPMVIIGLVAVLALILWNGIEP
jgi:hypothetical protein